MFSWNVSGLEKIVWVLITVDTGKVSATPITSVMNFNFSEIRGIKPATFDPQTEYWIIISWHIKWAILCNFL